MALSEVPLTGVVMFVVRLFAVLLAGAVLASPAYAGPPRVKPDSLGVNVQFLTIGGNFSPNPNPDPVNGNLGPWVQKMADAGIQVVRLPVRWSSIEGTAPDLFGNHAPLNWQATDWIVQAFADKGIRVAPSLGSTPQWARAGMPDEKYPPAYDSQFAWFAARFAERYRSGGTYWNLNGTGADLPIQTYEIWNEPNIWGYFKTPIGFSCNQLMAPQNWPGPQRYAQLFTAAYNAIKTADPQSIVMLGGLAGKVTQDDPDCSVEGFIQAFKMHTGVVPDAIGLHAYTGETAAGVQTYPPSWAEILYRVRRFRQQIDNLGWSSRPIYLNENGWVTWPAGYVLRPGQAPTTPEAVRGQNLAQVASKLLRSNCGIRQYQPHTWRTAETLEPDGSANAEKWYGLTDSVGTLHDLQWSTMMQRLRGNAASAPNPGYVDLCPWRGAVDIDGDGTTDPLDTTPIDQPDV